MPIDLVKAAVEFARRQGWDIDRMLAEVGVSPLLLGQDQARVTEDQLVRLVQRLWRETGDELLGLGAHPLPRGSFRLLAYGLLGAADMGEALARLRGFLGALPALTLDVAIGPDTTRVGIVAGRPANDPDGLLSLVGLAAAHRVLAWLVKKPLRLERVELPSRKPAVPAEAFFDAPIRFGAASPGIVFSSGLLSSPVMRQERDVDELVARSPRDLLVTPRYTIALSERVRRILEPGLTTGAWPSADAIARQLAMSPETVRRKLADEGTSVRQLTGDLRRDAAVTSLVRGGESTAELAARLGFSEVSAFSRAFRRWTGSTPGTYRKSGDPSA